MLFHPAVSFPAHIKGCYVTPLDQVWVCVCACCSLLLADTGTTSSHQGYQTVDGTQLAASSTVFMLSCPKPEPCSGQNPTQLCYAVTVRQNAQVWTRPYIFCSQEYLL